MEASPSAGAAAPPQLESAKLKATTEALEKRCDELAASLAAAIGDIEAGAIDARFGSWLAWIDERRRSGGVAVALAGPDVALRTRELLATDAPTFDGAAVAIITATASAPDVPLAIRMRTNALANGVTIVALLDDAALLHDAIAGGVIRRDCAGLLWLGRASDVPALLSELFADSILGIYALVADAPGAPAGRPESPPWTLMPPAIRPHPLATIVAHRVPPGAIAPIVALDAARVLAELAVAIVTDHPRENARLALQAAAGERARSARSLIEELTARKEFVTQCRDDVNRDLSASIDELAKVAASADADELFRGSVKRALDSVPALAPDNGKIVSRHALTEEERPQWWTGTSWARFSGAFAHSIKLTLPDRDLRAGEHLLSGEVTAIVAKPATRGIDRFERSLADFAATAGPDLNAAAVGEVDRAHWEREPANAIPPTLHGRCTRALGATIEKDFKLFHIDVERRGPIGRILEGRAAAGGLSALLLLGVRNTNTFGKLVDPAAWAHVDGGWAIVLNSSYYALPLLLIGFVIYSVTSGGKEDALVHDKISEARESFDDKLIAACKRFYDTELNEVKALLNQRKAVALDRLDRAADGLKQEIDELDRKTRGSGMKSRSALASLPLSLRGDRDKTLSAARDVQLELAARFLAPPPTPAAPATRKADTMNGAALAAAIKPSTTPNPPNPALSALAERAAKRAAAAAAAGADGVPGSSFSAALEALKRPRTEPNPS